MKKIVLKQIGRKNTRGKATYGYLLEKVMGPDGKMKRKYTYLGRYDPATGGFIKVGGDKTKRLKLFNRPGKDSVYRGTYWTGEIGHSTPYEVNCAHCGNYNYSNGKCKATGETVEDLEEYCNAWWLGMTKKDGK